MPARAKANVRQTTRCCYKASYNRYKPSNCPRRSVHSDERVRHISGEDEGFAASLTVFGKVAVVDELRVAALVPDAQVAGDDFIGGRLSGAGEPLIEDVGAVAQSKQIQSRSLDLRTHMGQLHALMLATGFRHVGVRL